MNNIDFALAAVGVFAIVAAYVGFRRGFNDQRSETWISERFEQREKVIRQGSLCG